MTEQIVLIAIGVVVAAFVLRPLLRRKRNTPSLPRPAAPTAGVSDELAELELDHEMGRVSEEDYQRWRAELERATPAPAVADKVAVAVPDKATARAEDLVREWREAPRPTCPNCGLRPEPGARFCSNCGASLAP
jgi:cytochrome c-type biogenesis protein CcmI